MNIEEIFAGETENIEFKLDIPSEKEKFIKQWLRLPMAAEVNLYLE